VQFPIELVVPHRVLPLVRVHMHGHSRIVLLLHINMFSEGKSLLENNIAVQPKINSVDKARRRRPLFLRLTRSDGKADSMYGTVPSTFQSMVALFTELILSRIAKLFALREKVRCAT